MPFLNDALRTVALAVGLTLGLVPSLAFGAIYGLHVGINDYAFERLLNGAVNDANDINRALDQFGAAETVLLTNGAATRTAIEREFRRLMDQANQGDVIVFSFSGHGSYEDDTNGDEARDNSPGDRRDETLVLGGFTAQTPAGRRERIVDDELAVWFSDATQRGIRVVFVADSCHSGTVNRGGEPGRYVSTPDNIQLNDPTAFLATPEEIPERPSPTGGAVFFLSAVNQITTVDERIINSVPRGALSYAFARALEGHADTNQDGVFTRDEIAEYITETVANHDDEARPMLEPRGGINQEILRRPSGALVPPPAPIPTPILTPTPAADGVGLSVVNGALSGPYPQGARPASGSEVELTYDAATGDLFDQDGVKVAENAPERLLQAFIDKYRILTLIRRIADRDSFPASLSPEAPNYALGSGLTLTVGPSDRRYLLVFNLANNGEVQQIYPYYQYEYGPNSFGGRAEINTHVDSPIGADHLAAISSNQDLTELRTAIERGASTSEVLGLVRALVDRTDLSARILPFYTIAR